MAVVQAGPFIRKRVFGFGDVASDAFTTSTYGASLLAAARAAAAALPSGFTMGDPTSDLWGASYYNGKKVIDDAAINYAANNVRSWGLVDGSYGPAWDQHTADLIAAAANAGYAVYEPVEAIRTASPNMFAILTDPEWIDLQASGKPIDWNSLSAELQAKIKLVPNLYDVLTGNLAAVAPPTITSGPTVAPTGPARYLIGGWQFLDDGTIIAYNGQPVTGTFTPDEVHSLLTTGALPSGDTGPVPAPSQAATSPVPAQTQPDGTGTVTLVPVAPDVLPPVDHTIMDANPTQSMDYQPRPISPSGPAMDVGGGGMVPAATASAVTGPPWLLIGAAAVALVLVSRKRGR